MKKGRPSKYKPEYCQKLIEHMSRGLSFECFAATIDVAEQTTRDWLTKYPEFLEAKKTAFSKSRLFWEELVIEAATSGQGSGVLIIFNLKNRFPNEWKDKREVSAEVSNVPKFVSVSVSSEEEMDKFVAKRDEEIKDSGLPESEFITVKLAPGGFVPKHTDALQHENTMEVVI